MEVSRTDRSNQYSIRLSGALTNLIILAVVNTLKDRRWLRAIAGFGGVLALILGGLLFIFPPRYFSGVPVGRIETPLLLIGFGFVMSAILAGPKFNLFIGEPPEVQERREAEEELGDARDPYSVIELDSKRLNEYYAINQSQARGSFRWAVFAMFIGLATIISGVWLFYLREDTPNTFLTSLSTASGLVINAVSAMYLYLHNRTQKRSLLYYGQLVRLQQLGLAIRLAESHDDSRKRAEAKEEVISEVLKLVRRSAIADAASAQEEQE